MTKKKVKPYAELKDYIATTTVTSVVNIGRPDFAALETTPVLADLMSLDLSGYFGYSVEVNDGVLIWMPDTDMKDLRRSE